MFFRCGLLPQYFWPSLIPIVPNSLERSAFGLEYQPAMTAECRLCFHPNSAFSVKVLVQVFPFEYSFTQL